MTGRASNNVPPSVRKAWEDQETPGKAGFSEPVAAQGKAIVCFDHSEKGGWKMQNVVPRNLGPGELLVEMVASGVCHSDLLCGNSTVESGLGHYPRIVGHEGSGYVKAVGPDVDVAAFGDPVICSYIYCNECVICKQGPKAHCPRFNEMNLFGQRKTFKLATADPGSDFDIGGVFFGQSSFAQFTIVNQLSVVNVKTLVHRKEDLRLFAPLGCGIQTGVGTVINAAQAGPNDSICITGVGGVGLSAVIGAKIAGCRTIIGVDRVASRLDLAKECGCTHVINGSELAEGTTLVDAVRAITEGAGSAITIETTGVPTLIEAGIEFTRSGGKYIQVGVAPLDYHLSTVNLFALMVTGKQIMGAIEGKVLPTEFVPKMIQWYREGKLPLEKMTKLLPAEEFESALHGMHDGTMVKPILVWS